MADVNQGADGDYPRVNWAEVRNHLVKRLLMDEEWMHEDLDEEWLAWWPSPLRMVVKVDGGGDFRGSTENWMRITGSTELGACDEEMGRQIAVEYVDAYPVGALVWRDGVLSLTTSYSLNPRNRPLLTWFHDALVIQAAVAFEIAQAVDGRIDVESAIYAHPTSGVRTDLDELAQVYRGEELSLPIERDVVYWYEVVRPEVQDMMFAGGYSLGFHNDEVDFFHHGFDADDVEALANGGFDVGVGFQRGNSLEDKFGPHLVIMARITAPGHQFDTPQISLANDLIGGLEFVSQFGYVGPPPAADSGMHLRAIVSYAVLAEWSQHPSTLATCVYNAVFHVASAAQVFRREVLRISATPTASGETG